MGDELLAFLCGLAFFLVVVTVVGHLLWLLAAAIFRSISGELRPQPVSTGRQCAQCGAAASVQGGRCTACGAVPAIVPGEAQREELKSTARQLWRLLWERRISQRQYDEMMVPVMADLSRQAVLPPATLPINADDSIVDAQLVETPAPIAGTEPGPGVPPGMPLPRKPTARQEPRPPELPPPVFVEPPRPARSLADMLQSFMEESNIRWGEILAALLIVLSSVGLVISLRNQLKSIPYFPALLFTVFTVSFHGAGIYTLRRWNLHAVSRVILIISLLLVPLTFSAAVVMSGSGESQRAVTDPLFLAALVVGTAIFAWVTLSASGELVGEGKWRLAIGVLGCSLSQVAIQRIDLATLGFWGLHLAAGIPLACFLAATGGQLLRWRAAPQLSRRRTNQIFLVLGIALFALLAPLALLLMRAEPRWFTAARLSPALSLAAAMILALGLLVHRRTTARDLATLQTAGTAIGFCGGFLLLVLVGLAWPEPELLCAVGIVNALVLFGLAIGGRLDWLHAPAIACAALAAVIGLHLAQGHFADRSALAIRILEATLMARTSLLLTGLAALAGMLAEWLRRQQREESTVWLAGAAVLSILSIAIAAVAGFVPIRGWQQDADLAAPLIVLYGVAFIFAGPLTRRPALVATGSFLLWAGLVQATTFNTTIRTALAAQNLLPERSILVATLLHAAITAGIALAAVGRQIAAGRAQFRRWEHSERAEHLVWPLSAGAAVSLLAVLPAICWVWNGELAWHSAYALSAAAAWGAVALAQRWKWAVSGLQAMLVLAPALLAADAWQAHRANDPWWGAQHLDLQLIQLALAAIFWSATRRLSSRSELARDLLTAPWPAVDQVLLGFATLATPALCFLWSLNDLAGELGFDASYRAAGFPGTELSSLVGRGFVLLLVLLLALVACCWERVTAAALIGLGIASFAAVFLIAQFWDETDAVASAVRWAAGGYALAWALPFVFRRQLAIGAKRLAWLRWERKTAARGTPPLTFSLGLAQWYCFQPLLLGGVTVLALATLAVAQIASGVPLRGPGIGSIFHQIGPTASYAGPLLALVAVLLAYAVRERQAGFALGGSAVFQLAANLAFLLYVTTTPALPPAIRWIEWLQWNSIAAGAYALVWLGLRRWIPGGRILLDVQTVASAALTFCLAAWGVQAIAIHPLTPPPETAQIGAWLSYAALALASAGIGWQFAPRLKHAGDLAVCLATALVPLVACSLDARDTARHWYAYHTLLCGWLALGMLATAAIAMRRYVTQFTAAPSHVLAAILATLVTLLAIWGASRDPGQPWWSFGATLGVLATIGTLGIVRRSQPYAYGSVALAGLGVILFWVGSRSSLWYGLGLDSLPAIAEQALLAMIVVAGFWLGLEIRAQRREDASFDRLWPGSGIHATLIVIGFPLYALWRLANAAWSSEPLSMQPRDVVAIAVVVSWGLLIAGTLWDRRAMFALPMLYLGGLCVSLLAIELCQPLFAPPGERLAVLLLALAVQAAFAGQLWSYGANLSVLGARLDISDPIGGLARTERWLPPVNLALAALVCLGALPLVLNLDRLELRVVAAWAPAVAAWGVLCLAQQRRRDALQLTALLLAGLTAVYLGWAQLDPDEAAQTWGLSRAFRLLMVLAAATFAYGLVLPRFLLTAGSWHMATRRAGFASGVAAMATFIAVLALEVMLFQPGVDAPIDGVQVAAIAVVLVGLIAGLLSLALLPEWKEDAASSQLQRQAYVYAAEATGALLFAHLYICRPTWFDTALRPYWPLIVMGIAFAGVGLSELCHRFRIRVLAEPLERTGALLPLLPVLGVWIVSARTEYSLLLLVVGLLYLVLSVTRKSWAALIAAALAGNGALWALLDRTRFDVASNPQFWLIPPALSVLAAAQLNRSRLPPPTLAAIRYLATIVIYLSSTSEIFIRGVGESLWPPMILAGLSVAGAMLGIMLRIRAFLYLGSSFTLLALITMVWHASRAIEHVWPWWAFGIGLGIAILVLFGVFEKKRPEVLALIGRLRQWEQ
ncbi:MAG: hypothetical protein WD872_18345 [Pirellulaceae bacterium]